MWHPLNYSPTHCQHSFFFYTCFLESQPFQVFFSRRCSFMRAGERLSSRWVYINCVNHGRVVAVYGIFSVIVVCLTCCCCVFSCGSSVSIFICRLLLVINAGVSDARCAVNFSKHRRAQVCHNRKHIVELRARPKVCVCVCVCVCACVCVCLEDERAHF